MKQILCPIDFSETSLNALEYAVSIADKHRANLSLVYVFTEEYYNEHLTEGVKNYQEYEEDFQSRLDVIAGELKSKSFSCTAHVLSGNFLKSIENFIPLKSIDFVVVGTKGLGDVFDKIVGSNTIKLIDNFDIPILVVPKKASFEGLNKVVFATTYRDEDKIALRQLSEFSAPFKSSITVLHLSKRDNLIEEVLLSNFKEELKALIDCENISFDTKTYSENLVLGIDKHMSEEQSNVLAILMEKRNLIDRLFHKSVTKELSYMMDYPILIYKKD
ncbi:MAG: nucleotide-binding universal stress UspA family protein [Cyclobacteriaceae bacterium]|jgi:nucleotide-binding universal stress UspA family protein